MLQDFAAIGNGLTATLAVLGPLNVINPFGMDFCMAVDRDSVF
jgi:hypothetical protein